MSNTLKPGSYMIESLLNGNAVHRFPTEDHSLLPKAIFLLSKGVQGHGFWDVKRTNDGGYILAANRSPVATIDGKLFAILLDMPPPQVWDIKLSERDGPDCFIIAERYSPRGWVANADADDDELNQISVRPLIIGPSYPPFYPPNEVFKFIRVDRD
ncbi:hypothetical protein EUX98_g1124 [Antrodiella citrinella]|uniref:Uncharacterized protein n=1 Tax=Antrodiella citrinella TaxID=2447956 RepID=A0A4S4N554_9APHY|nr:hypothetical protein EUX98_g1124 [Antrodiella citrinella]